MVQSSLFDMLACVDPPLKWAGGKRWLVQHLRRIWEPHAHRRMVEPFCGGLAVTLGLSPDRALANDVNRHLINFYQQVQRGLCVELQMANDEQLYYQHRARFNSLAVGGGIHTAEAAQLFWYLNRTCFNGLCRFNASGGFNVPFGKYSTINYRRDFADCTDAFARCEFLAGDFSAVPLRPDDFVYADPPYDVDFTDYSAGGFDWRDQVRTAEWLARHPGPVVLSNQATDRIVALYTQLGFELQFLNAPRRIACTGDRKPAREVLATRNIEVRR